MDAATSWKSRFLKVWPYATSSVSILFFATTACGLVIAWMMGAKTPLSFVLAVFDPAIASLVLLFVAFAQPSVFAGERFRPPHAFTIPIVYVATVFAVKTLGTDGAKSIQRLEGAGRFDLIWLRPEALLGTLVVLVAVFLVIGSRAKPLADVE